MCSDFALLERPASQCGRLCHPTESYLSPEWANVAFAHNSAATP
jgi:hypothetical protein